MNETKKNPELLAPVGGEMQLTAALFCGADAVYFGAPGFNARRNAENFSGEDFINAVSRCRERGVKAYITFNTLITDRELSEAVQTLSLIALSGADGIIVQDLAAAELVKKCCPALPLHASTQMAVHNVAGAKALEKAGFSRIVLAREMSLGEIKAVTENVGAEVEVFVHGAHCMSASGMCYLSSAFGDRSGNRGLCAQPCRLNFTVNGRENALSLKDMCLAEHIGELKKAGVSSLKIEGRMKRPEYVAAAVSAYREALDGKKPDIDTLRSVFSRSGFTDGYLEGKRNLDMFGSRTKEDVVSAAPVLGRLQNLYKSEKQRIPLDMSFTAKENEKAALTVSDGKNSVTVTGEIPEKALKLELTAENAGKSLFKLGGTFYLPGDFSAFIAPGLMLPASALNAMRREAVEKLSEIRRAPAPLPFSPYRMEKPAQAVYGKMKTRLYFERVSMLPEGVSADLIILPADEILRHPDDIKSIKSPVAAAMPVLIYPGSEDAEREKLSFCRALGITKAYCENIGALAIAKDEGFELLGGAMLNIMNSVSLAKYAESGVRDLTFSTETSFSLIEEALIPEGVDAGFVAYCHAPLMRFRACPMQGKNGCGSCGGHGTLTDRMGEKFTVLCSGKRYSTLLNPVALYTGDKKMPPLAFATLMFFTETKEECGRIITHFNNGTKPDFPKTMGLYNKTLR